MRFGGQPTPWSKEHKAMWQEWTKRHNSHEWADGECVRCGTPFESDPFGAKALIPFCSDVHKS